MRDFLREFAECVRALPGFVGEQLSALANEMEHAKVVRASGGYTGSVPANGGEPIRLTRGVAFMPQAMIDKYGDVLRELQPDTDLVAFEDMDDEEDAQ